MPDPPEDEAHFEDDYVSARPGGAPPRLPWWFWPIFWPCLAGLTLALVYAVAKL